MPRRGKLPHHNKPTALEFSSFFRLACQLQFKGPDPENKHAGNDNWIENVTTQHAQCGVKREELP
jgi:hypothetical protein